VAAASFASYFAPLGYGTRRSTLNLADGSRFVASVLVHPSVEEDSQSDHHSHNLGKVYVQTDTVDVLRPMPPTLPSGTGPSITQ
jgi:hypothetical protein